ncbi:N-acetylmuramoyl-L-alanine amidase family protein [Clostridium cylindrosporum]|uniref:N-acetylmuramoyl-L-alanine amidase n=1 Tax=Clostridium cylindrosporum DSM 605 TaxID=1121307 RepID=A0A0J8DC73_CLOCY|nr:N-acetylmuramoyl-L-alanine amidase [Clostridium cylindrosporum]KMT21858.1 N-acetylmuramoyl-L-alanine amidase [Clostridium cylindrosporum DSM 605]
MDFYGIMYISLNIICKFKLKGVCKIKRVRTKIIIPFVLLFTFVLNVLGLVNPAQDVHAASYPKITGAQIVDKSPRVGLYPTLKLTSKGYSSVQYSVYKYIPAKKTWQNVSGGYTKAVSGTKPYSIKLKTPLHQGDNIFSVWVKRAGKKPLNKGGYDSALSYKVKVADNNFIPKVTSVSIDKKEIKLGQIPSVTVKSSGNVKVQYKVLLYSESKEVFEDVSNGYTKGTEPSKPTTIKTTSPLKPGKNTFRVWIKKDGLPPMTSSGYDSSTNYIVDVPVDKNASKILDVKAEGDKFTIGSKAKISIKGESGDGSNISYKAFLYSKNKDKWIDASNYINDIKSGEVTTLELNTPLEEGKNKVLIWSKRSSVKNDVYEDFKKLEINATKPEPVKKKIVIDPGHGGKDPGSLSSSGTNERDIVLSVALKLGPILESNGYEILYTRDDNENVNWNSLNKNESLRYRANLANTNGADIFVSIHCNSTDGVPGSGTETFYSTKKSSKDKELATLIQKELVKSIGLRDRGAKPNDLAVLDNTTMPAALVELAFINNPNEEAKLKDEDFQLKAANGIANGIIKFFSK